MLRPVRPQRLRLRRALTGTIAAAGLLAAAAAASAAPSIGGPNGWTTNPVYPVTEVGLSTGNGFTWTAGPASGSGSYPGTINLNSLPDGAYTLVVQDPPFQASKSIGIDRVDPNPVLNLVPADTTVQFGAAKSVSYSCPDASSGVANANCIASIGAATYPSGGTLPTNSLGTKTVTLTATDRAGNTASVSKSYTVVDTVAPSAPSLVAPLEPTGDTTPTFQWLGASDAGGSGIDKYTLTVVNSGGGTVISQDVNAPSTSYTPSTALANGAYTWVVNAVDNAGNSTASATGSFAIDTGAPAPPTISNGPGGGTGSHTSDTTPSFTISGPGPGFSWEVVAGDDETVDAGLLTAPGTITTTTLAEGQYSLRVVQVSAVGIVSPAAVYVFTVDTTPPKGVNLWGRPVSPGTRPNPVFSWTGPEADINYSWSVAQGDKVVQGPVVTPGGQANLQPLEAGSYKFTVTPVDLANNSGPSMSVPFVINDVPAPPKPSVAVKGKNKKKSLVIKTRNVRKLSPKVGRTLTSRRPVLRWRKTTRDTVLYNLQIFAVKGRKLVKVYSAFPSGTRFRVPNRRLGFGHTYVWQVFAYRGPVKGYLPRPIGISWFRTKARSPKRLLLPRAKSAKAGKRLTVRWKKAGRSRYYRVDLVRGSKRVWARRTTGRTVRVPASRLEDPGVYKLIVRRGTAPKASGRVYAKKAWVGTKIKVVR